MGLSIGRILNAAIPVVTNLFKSATSKSGAAPAFGHSGASSFEASSKASATGDKQDKDWFKKAVMQSIMHSITQSMDQNQAQFKKAYKNGL